MGMPAEFEGTSETIIAADGTPIAFHTTGHGPGVIVIPGALSVAAGFARFARTLGERFTVHIMERRGRGDSGPQGEDYSIDTELEDLRALRDKTGATLLVGHSYGGLIALEAARDPEIRKVAIYEPGVSVNGSMPSNWIPSYEKYLRQDKPWKAFVQYLRAVGPEGIRRVPKWMLERAMPLAMKAPERDIISSLLWENLREHREVIRLDDTYPHYRDITAEVLLMDGDRDRLARDDADRDRLAEVIPHCVRYTFRGLDHFGIDKNDPALVAATVAEFLDTP
ncbi:alpha/beta hydrolase [Nocardia otitidiscaviarum]|uniref:Alpha/beta hydrolase n=1 Tax=Nocardia otitidiscaviarum TaxID=1823 RepID=A0A516NK83_9NOCA|nr:alpha/beta hydrolase [Nocardia otitidiscaviarum]MCP9624786.1 alpha/beta hydrolase [Nocardia otitidiscaviarum]QDP79314.1 alpha/beta hydrolase [Nocardia otitidiscaviarum]